jgi:hypothetical protein
MVPPVGELDQDFSTGTVSSYVEGILVDGASGKFRMTPSNVEVERSVVNVDDLGHLIVRSSRCTSQSESAELIITASADFAKAIRTISRFSSRRVGSIRASESERSFCPSPEIARSFS